MVRMPPWVAVHAQQQRVSSRWMIITLLLLHLRFSVMIKSIRIGVGRQSENECLNWSDWTNGQRYGCSEGMSDMYININIYIYIYRERERKRERDRRIYIYIYIYLCRWIDYCIVNICEYIYIYMHSRCKSVRKTNIHIYIYIYNTYLYFILSLRFTMAFIMTFIIMTFNKTCGYRRPRASRVPRCCCACAVWYSHVLLDVMMMNGMTNAIVNAMANLN